MSENVELKTLKQCAEERAERLHLPPGGKYREGDRVKIGTWEGELPELSDSGLFFIKSSSGTLHSFLEDGRAVFYEDFGPLMRFIERPKRKVKRGVILFSHDGTQAWSYGDTVQSNAGSVIWQGEIEVEE